MEAGLVRPHSPPVYLPPPAFLLQATVTLLNPPFVWRTNARLNAQTRSAGAQWTSAPKASTLGTSARSVAGPPLSGRNRPGTRPSTLGSTHAHRYRKVSSEGGTAPTGSPRSDLCFMVRGNTLTGTGR